MFIPKLNMDATKKKIIYRPICLMNIDNSKILKIMANQTQQYIKKVIYCELLVSFQRCKDVSTYAN
jgi:hypothetical protein